MPDKLIFLAHRNEKLQESSTEVMACTFCRNKCFLFVFEGPKSFPRVQCAACKNNLGYVGWYHPDDPENQIVP